MADVISRDAIPLESGGPSSKYLGPVKTEDRGDVSTSQGFPTNHQKLEEARKDSPLRFQRERGSC